MAFRSHKKNRLSKKVFHSLLNEEILSIQKDQERFSLVCKNKVISIPSKWKNGLLHVDLTKNDIRKHCGNNKVSLTHTHILHTAKPSEQDFESLKHRLGKNVNEFCVAGVDGVGCYDINKQTEKIFKHWNKSDFDKKMRSIGGNVWYGKHVYCDGHQNLLCELDRGKDKIPIQMGIFSNIVLRNGTQIFQKNDADIALNTHLKNEIVRCVAVNGNETIFCEVIENDN